MSATGTIGVTNGPPIEGALGYVVIVFDCIAIYNTFELTFIIWGYFKRHAGLYFWSFIVATYGILLYATGFIVKTKSNADNPSPYIYATFIVVGWVTMVTGQSMVLWSRLHLVLRDPDKLRLILYMIIFNVIAMHLPVSAMVYGANSSNPGPFLKVYSVYEKIQVTVFFVQELIISSFYIVETIKLARLQSAVRRNRKRSKRLMIHLVIVNVIIILLDCTILVLEYADRYALQTSWKGLVYSVKLKMEFPILNRLKEMTTGCRDSSSDPSGPDVIQDSVRRAQEWPDDRAQQKHSEGSYQKHSEGNSQIGASLALPEHSYRKPLDSLQQVYAASGNPLQDDLERYSHDDVTGETELVVEMQNWSNVDRACYSTTPIGSNTCEGTQSTKHIEVASRGSRDWS